MRHGIIVSHQVGPVFVISLLLPHKPYRAIQHTKETWDFRPYWLFETLSSTWHPFGQTFETLFLIWDPFQHLTPFSFNIWDLIRYLKPFSAFETLFIQHLRRYWLFETLFSIWLPFGGFGRQYIALRTQHASFKLTTLGSLSPELFPWATRASMGGQRGQKGIYTQKGI